MSESAAEPRDLKLWLEQQLVQVARDRQETQKLIDEARKLQAEALKLDAETMKMHRETLKFDAETMNLHREALKFDAEAMKLNRDRGLAPWLAIVGLIGGLLAIANFALRFIHP